MGWGEESEAISSHFVTHYHCMIPHHTGRSRMGSSNELRLGLGERLLDTLSWH